MQGGIDPAVLKFVLALVVAAIAVELLSRISEGAAWALAGLIILGLFLNNPILTGFINLGTNSLKGAIT